MKNHFNSALFIFLFLIINPYIQSQEKTSKNIGSKYAYAEKIYLQLSSTVFTTDNTIWFKATVTDLMHLPTKLSGVLHVELIDFDKRIIDKKLLKIEQGIADSFFDLNEDMPPGHYQIRAYTEWNKNFENEFISQIYIDIYEPKKVLETEEAIRGVTLTETKSNQFELSANVYPELLNPKYKGKLKMYIHTETKTDSVEIKKNKDASYSFQYTLPKDVIKLRMELKLDSVKLRNNNKGFISSYSKTTAVNKEYLDLQFFPEGGKLVNGLTSFIAFKALDYNNKGKEVTGFIVDQNDNIIIPFQSNALGMGKTYVTPNIQKTYYASIKNKDGIELKYLLPEINQTGVVLQVKEVQDYIIISLKTKDLNQEPLRVKVQCRGVQYDDFNVQFKAGKASGGIEKQMLPEGIIKFIITNKANQIISERLFFNYKEETRINITATPNIKQYSQRDKTILNIATKDKDSNAIKANLSVLVINKAQLGAVNDTRSNILSYFLLNSELRGSIENPSYYFNQENKSRKQDLDALLLTQGWSNYKNENKEFSNAFKFLPEIGLNISGKIKNILFSKKELKNPVELTAVYGSLNVATQQVDSTGYFKMYLEDYFKDKFKVALQTKNEKGKKKDYIIELDEYKTPIINYKKEEKVQLADSVSLYVNENIKRKQKEDNIKLVDGIIELNEVELTGYNLTPQREKMMDLHGPPDLVIENEELLSKVEKWHSGLFSLLESSFPNDIQINDAVGFLEAKIYGQNFTFIVIDGVPVKLLDYPFIQSLPIEEIKSFELIKNPKIANYYMNEVFQAPFGKEEVRIIGLIPDSTSPLYEGLDGVGVYENPFNRNADDFILKIDLEISIISIYTYAGKGLNYIGRNKGINKFNIQGFTPKREFYAPKHNNLTSQDWNEPDLRAVVHWQPNINTDEVGNAKVEFYNADYTGDMLIIVEGITENGKLGHYETTYTVDKKLER